MNTSNNKGKTVRRIKIDYRCLLICLDCFSFLRENGFVTMLKDTDGSVSELFDIKVKLKDFKHNLIEDFLFALSLNVKKCVAEDIYDFCNDVSYNKMRGDAFMSGDYVDSNDETILFYETDIEYLKENVIRFTVGVENKVASKTGDFTDFLLERIEFVINGFTGDFEFVGESNSLERLPGEKNGKAKFELEIDFSVYDPNKLEELPSLVFSQMVRRREWIKYIDNLSKDPQLAKVRKNGMAIKYIENPSEEVQLAAVQQNGMAIKYIENPSEEVQLAAVQQKEKAIKYIENPSEEFQLAAVKQNKWVFQYIKNPSEEVQLAAVEQNGALIDYIKNPSEEVQLAAVKNNSFAIQYIKNSSVTLQLVAVQRVRMAIRYIENPSEEFLLAAVKQDKFVFEYIKNPSEKVQLAAVQQEGMLIIYIQNPSEEVQLAAVKQNSLAIQYIKNPSPKVKDLVKKECF